MSDRKRKNPVYVPRTECILRHETLTKEIGRLADECQKIKDALVGEDMQSGLVKAVAEIQSKLKLGGTLADWLKPIIVAVIASGLTALLISHLHA